MKKILFAFALFIPLCISCIKDDNNTAAGRKKFSIAVENEIPTTAFPGEDIEFLFSIKFADGIKSAYATADGKEIEGGRYEYSDKPDSVSLNFKYRVMDTYAGNSIDFAVTAEAVDGTLGHYDIPVFILAAKPDINFSIPEDVPGEFLIDGSSLNFPVTITSGSIDMKSLTTYKNEAVLPEMSYELPETDVKKTVLDFNYTPTLGDVGQTVFTFEIMDVNGNLVSSNYSVTFFKKASEELNEYTGIKMGLNKCTSAGQFLDAITGTVYVANGVGAHCEEIDIAIFWSNNAGTNGAAFAAPISNNIKSIYPEATIVTTLGGTTADIPANWATRNESNIRSLYLSADEFAAVETCQEVRDLFETGEKYQEDNDHVSFSKKAGSTMAFKINRPDGTVKYGVIRVTSSAANNTGSLTFDYKIEK